MQRVKGWNADLEGGIELESLLVNEVHDVESNNTQSRLKGWRAARISESTAEDRFASDDAVCVCVRERIW